MDFNFAGALLLCRCNEERVVLYQDGCPVDTQSSGWQQAASTYMQYVCACRPHSCLQARGYRTGVHCGQLTNLLQGEDIRGFSTSTYSNQLAWTLPLVF